MFNEVITGVHTAHVTYAARDSEFAGYDIKAGQYLALLDGGLIGSFSSQDELLESLGAALEELEPEFLSVYYGSDVAESDALSFSNVLEERFPRLGAHAPVRRAARVLLHHLRGINSPPHNRAGHVLDMAGSVLF